SRDWSSDVCSSDLHGPIAASEVEALTILHAARLEFGHGEKLRRAALVLLSEPDVVAEQNLFASYASQQRRVMAGEDQLRPSGIGVRATETSDPLCREVRMQM